MSDLVGRTLLGRYRIDGFLGRGGMADVYRAWDKQRQVMLAMKLLRAELAEDLAFLGRFRREALVLQRLQHPNIVRYYDLEQDDVLTFMLMDCIEGSNLRTEIVRRRAPFAPGEILRYFQPICSALQYAHTQGVVHCDMKPGNVLIDGASRVYISDFGIARAAEGVTVTLATPGTPAYMSPEQCRGAVELDARTDVYALGIILYEMATGGVRPFSGDTNQASGTAGERIRWQHIHEAAPPPLARNGSLPAPLARVILRCLAKRPQDRYQTSIELFVALEQAAQAPVATGPTNEVWVAPPARQDSAKLSPPAKPAGRQNRAGAVLVLLAVAVVIVIMLPFLGLSTLAAGPAATRGGVLPSTQIALAVRLTLQANSRATATPSDPVTYPAQSCVQYGLAGTAASTQITECVTSVVVLANQTMKFGFTWSLKSSDATMLGVQYHSDSGNRNMYLTDNVGRRLDHIQAGGGAAADGVLANGVTREGWFLFPAPALDANSFIFHDDDQGQQLPAVVKSWP